MATDQACQVLLEVAPQRSLPPSPSPLRNGPAKSQEGTFLRFSTLVKSPRFAGLFSFCISAVKHPHEHLKLSKRLMVYASKVEIQEKISMACYPCTHCNKCGMYYSVPTAMVCAECETVVPIGAPGCPSCGCKKVKAVPVSSLNKNGEHAASNPEE